MELFYHSAWRLQKRFLPPPPPFPFSIHIMSTVAGPPQLSDKDKETVRKYAGGTEDHLFLQFLTYAAKARCVRECKAEALTPKQRYPDPEVLVRFKNRDPYSYLHFSYYQVYRER